jgi:hypothetical protein
LSFFFSAMVFSFRPTELARLQGDSSRNGSNHSFALALVPLTPMNWGEKAAAVACQSQLSAPPV